MKRVKEDQREGMYCCLSCFDGSIAFVRAQGSKTGELPLTIHSCQWLPNVLSETSQGASALKQLIKTYELATIPCHLVLTPNDYRLLPIDIPEYISENELSSALPLLVKDLIDVPLDTIVVDTFPMITHDGSTHKPYAVIASVEQLIRRQQQLINAGFNLVTIDIADLAWSSLLVTLADSTESLALLVRMSTGCQIVVNQRSVLSFSRMIQTTIQSNTSDYALDQLALEIQRSLDYAQTQLRQAVPINVFIAPLQEEKEDNSTPLWQSLAQRLSNPVKPLDLSSLFSFKTTTLPIVQQHCLLVLAQALRVGMIREDCNETAN